MFPNSLSYVFPTTTALCQKRVAGQVTWGLRSEYDGDLKGKKSPVTYWGLLCAKWGFPGGSGDKESTCNAGDTTRFLGWEDPLEKEMATHSSIVAWRLPQREEPGGLQSMGSQKIWTHLKQFSTHARVCQVLPAFHMCYLINPHGNSALFLSLH